MSTDNLFLQYKFFKAYNADGEFVNYARVPYDMPLTPQLEEHIAREVKYAFSQFPEVVRWEEVDESDL